MADQSSLTVLVVSADAERRDRAAAALSSAGEVIQAADMSSALNEVSLGHPVVTVIDCTLPQDVVSSLVAAIGDPDRVVLWVPELQLELLDYGVFVQIPYTASDRVLAAAVQRLAEAQRAKSEIGKTRGQAGKYRHVVAIVRDVHHKVNSPLTAIIAEAQLLLMDADQLSTEQRKSLETIEAMAQRIRDLLRQLEGLGRA